MFTSPFKTCPDEEGIKTFRSLPAVASRVDSKLALMKKGLRLSMVYTHRKLVGFKTCPDEEGIKTRRRPLCSQLGSYSKLALMKKGLRLLLRNSRSFFGQIQNLP